MALIQIFRVENVDGWGPYAASHYNDVDWMEHDHTKSPTTPPPFQDSGLTYRLGEIEKNIGINYSRFGFESLNHLNNWLSSKELEVLRFRGFEVKSYYVKEAFVYKGTHQVIFHKDYVSHTEDQLTLFDYQKVA